MSQLGIGSSWLPRLSELSESPRQQRKHAVTTCNFLQQQLTTTIEYSAQKVICENEVNFFNGNKATKLLMTNHAKWHETEEFEDRNSSKVKIKM